MGKMIKFYASYFGEASRFIRDAHEFQDVRNDISKIDEKMYAIEQACAYPQGVSICKTFYDKLGNWIRSFARNI